MFVHLRLVNNQRGFVGKEKVEIVFLPFIKLFNKPWMHKREDNVIMYSGCVVIVWILKIVNILVMIALILLYFCVLSSFLIVVHLLYYAVLAVLLLLIPVGLVRLNSRIGNKLGDLKSAVIYDKQQTFTWYPFDKRYNSAVNFMLFH